jgi:hypothetical protein
MGVRYEVLENQRKMKVGRGEVSGFKKSRGIEKPPEEQIKSEGFNLN